jgi:hypothetical protein
MIELTDHLTKHVREGENGNPLDFAFKIGVQQARKGSKPTRAYAQWQQVRERYGFVPTKASTDLLTPPSANMKLNKGATPAYGLTLQHHVTSFPQYAQHPRITVNGCPFAGDCVKVCVLNNGNGMYPAVQRARKARTELLVRYPLSFVAILAYELVRAEKNNGFIHFRPNVNSDIAWERVLPSMFDPKVMPHVLSYGYSKRPEVLDTDGWLAPRYRVAYSWNETSKRELVDPFLARGGSVAMVTARKKGDHQGSPYGYHVTTLNADKTDEWVFDRGVIGDLSAKGKARSLIGKSGFVVSPNGVVSETKVEVS